MFHRYEGVDVGVIHLPRWWPFSRSFALWWVFLTPSAMKRSREALMLTLVHEAQHCRDQRKRWLFGFLIPWAVHPPSRLDLEARGFAASIRYARDVLHKGTGWLSLYENDKATSLRDYYWFRGRYDYLDCLDAIRRYL